MELIPHSLTASLHTGYSEFISIWYRSRSPHRNGGFTPLLEHETLRLNVFRENQLAPGSIGISPLTTAHPLTFQRQSVRTSTWYHPSFILAMVRSPGFGSINTDKRPIQTRFRYGSTISGLTRQCL